MNLAKQIETFLNSFIKLNKNNQEFLLKNTTNIDLTNTQEHVLMLLKENNYSKSELATKLNLTNAAITKAMKNLEQDKFLIIQDDENDKRKSFVNITEKAEATALSHLQQHQATTLILADLVNEFNEEERKVISLFLYKLERTLNENY